MVYSRGSDTLSTCLARQQLPCAPLAGSSPLATLPTNPLQPAITPVEVLTAVEEDQQRRIYSGCMLV